jgi:hypothetical protein
MQRMITMFPRGLPGLALVILRVGVALTLLIRVTEQWPHVAALFLTGYSLSSLALLFGVLTPIAALAAILLILFAPGQKLSNENILDFIVESVVLSLLGPSLLD